MNFFKRLFGSGSGPAPPTKIAAPSPTSGNDCPADVVELIDTLFARGADAVETPEQAYAFWHRMVPSPKPPGAGLKQRKESAEEQLKEHPKRAAAIILLTRKFREDPSWETEYRVCDILEAIGTPDGSFDWPPISSAAPSGELGAQLPATRPCI